MGFVVLACPEVEDGSAAEPELDPDLDEERQVAVRDRLEGSNGAAHVVVPPELLREAQRGLALTSKRASPIEHDRSVLVRRQARHGPELGTAEHAPNLLSNVSVFAVEEAPQNTGIERGLGSATGRLHDVDDLSPARHWPRCTE